MVPNTPPSGNGSSIVSAGDYVPLVNEENIEIGIDETMPDSQVIPD